MESTIHIGRIGNFKDQFSHVEAVRILFKLKISVVVCIEINERIKSCRKQVLTDIFAMGREKANLAAAAYTHVFDVIFQSWVVTMHVMFAGQFSQASQGSWRATTYSCATAILAEKQIRNCGLILQWDKGVAHWWLHSCSPCASVWRSSPDTGWHATEASLTSREPLSSSGQHCAQYNTKLILSGHTQLRQYHHENYPSKQIWQYCQPITKIQSWIWVSPRHPYSPCKRGKLNSA